MEIRFVKKEDSKTLLNIYTPYVENTVITFEYDVPSIEEFTSRVVTISNTMPYLVAIDNGEIVGYAYATKYKHRAAYNWSVELSIYLDQDKRQRGVGTILYNHLLTILKELGYYRALACITSPNPMSVTFHEKHGFKTIGTFQKIGYKFDSWLDIIWMELSLQDHDHKPKSVMSIQEYQEMKK